MSNLNILIIILIVILLIGIFIITNKLKNKLNNKCDYNENFEIVNNIKDITNSFGIKINEVLQIPITTQMINEDVIKPEENDIPQDNIQFPNKNENEEVIKSEENDIPQDNIQFPNKNENDIQPICISQDTNDFKIIADDDTQLKYCKNAGLSEERYNKFSKIVEKSKYINNIKFPICNDSEIIQPIELNDDYDIDYLQYYRERQIYVKSYLEDPIMRGYNVNSFDNVSLIQNTGKIPLEKQFMFPKPNGYMFSDSAGFNK